MWVNPQRPFSYKQSYARKQAEQKQQEKTANISLVPPPHPPHKITSDERAQKFRIDETSLTRSSTSN